MDPMHEISNAARNTRATIFIHRSSNEETQG